MNNPTQGQGRPTPQRSTEPEDADFEDLPETPEAGMVRAPAASLVPTGTQMTTQTRYVTAMQVPVKRVIEDVRTRSVKEAEMAGADFCYAWTQQGQKIEGVSIDGAMIMLRNWGNCTCEIEVVVDAPTHWILRATYIDFETGLSFPRLFRQRKNLDMGKMKADRVEDIGLSIGQSKAQRNAIVKAMPTWLVNACVEASKTAAAAGIKDLPKSIESWVNFYGKKGVTLDRLEARVGSPRAMWTALDVVMLGQINAALKDGHTKIENEFPVPEVAPTEEAKAEAPKTEAKADAPKAETPPSEPKKEKKQPQREPGEEG